MKRIKIWQILVLLISALTIIQSCKKEDTVYELEFDIDVPDGWDVYESPYDDYVRYSALSPDRLEDDMALQEDTLNESVTVYRAYIPGYSLIEFSDDIYDNLLLQTGFVALHYNSDTIVNGEDAQKLIHLQTIRVALQDSPLDSVDLDIASLKLMFYRNDYGYMLECLMVPFTYSYYKPIFEEDIIPTFVFKE